MRRLERLSQHLAAEYLRAARVAALAAKQVHLETLEIELLLKIGQALVHRERTPGQPNLNAPFMSAEWPGKRADERVRLALLQHRGREFHARGLAATDDLGVGDDTRVALLDVIVGESGAHAVIGNALHVGGLGEDPVVAHGLRRQLAGVLERDFDFGAVGSHGDLFLVELHLVGAGDLHLADLVGGERAGGGKQQRQAGNCAGGFHE